jgi:hypothetical protein
MAASAGVVAGAILIVTAFLLLSIALFFPPLTTRLRLPVQKLIRATNGRPGAAAGDPAAFPLRLAAFSLLDPAHPVARSCERTGRPSRAVLAWRVVGVLLAAASLAVNGATPPGFRAGGPPAWFLCFFTNWTFILFLGTSLLGTYVSARAVWRDRAQRVKGGGGGGPAGATTSTSTLPPAGGSTFPPPQPPQQQQQQQQQQHWTWPAQAHVLATACLTPSTLFITIFYWGALFPAMAAPQRASPDAVMKHGANAAWAVLDALLSRTPACSAHFSVLAAYVFTYVVFMWCYAASTGTWMYGVLDWTVGPKTLAVYAALPALLALCAVVWFGLAAGREACLVRRECGWRSCVGRRRREGGEGAVAV